jgi:hypothetical protein
LWDFSGARAVYPYEHIACRRTINHACISL